MPWKPGPRLGVDPTTLPLNPAQGYLLSLLDGTLGVPELGALLNLDEPQVQLRLAELVALGAVTAAEAAGQPEAMPKEAGSDPVEAQEPDCEESASEVVADSLLATHRQRFERQLQARPLDLRAAQARVAGEPDLSAFCFDPAAKVIHAVLENPRTGGTQARIIAAHHRTAAGLEALGARAAFANDGGVRRALLQNPLLPPGLYRRLWSSRRLLEQFLVASSREAPEQVRAMARDQLRTSFSQRPGEERAELILATEGRCLALLTGLAIDGHATALLCRRTFVSTLFIQNLARWSATPPQLIAHLRRQETVKRNPPLRQLLERHPNAS